MRTDAHPSALTIAGSDSGGGAGIQADLKTFQALGVHGTSVITAITAQNTRTVSAVHRVPGAHITAQLEAVFDDFAIAAMKSGMLVDAYTIRTVARALAGHASVAYVLDPVMIATSGAQLLDPAATLALRKHLLPLARVVTPNLPEAEALSGRRIRRSIDIAAIAATLRDDGAAAVLIKGGHDSGNVVVDRLYLDGAVHEFRHPRLKRSGHGTGCTLAAAITAELALGKDLVEACRVATDYVHAALLTAYRPGRSKIDVLNHAAGSTIGRPGRLT